METKISAIVVTISDTRKLEDDRSGDALEECLRGIGAEVLSRELISDDFQEISEMLFSLSETRDANLLVTTGGTGLAPRDNTPEATQSVIEREVPGISEVMRMETLTKTRRAMLSRGVSGVRNGTLIINFPGSPKGVFECFDAIKEVLPHAIAQLSGYTDH